MKSKETTAAISHVTESEPPIPKKHHRKQEER